jgi:cytochrome c biogenesis protein CcmG, thiol:disulfide interchange protein DsbE
VTHRAQTSEISQESVDPESSHGVRRRFAMRLLCALLACSMLSVPVLAGRASALDSGAPVPEIGLTDLSGKRIDLASLKGKVVIIDFWASWCAPCKQEMPILERLFQKYKDRGFVVVGVSVDQEDANVGSFVKQLKVSFPIVHDKAHGVANRYRPPRMPSSYIVDRQGIVRHVHGGFRAADASAIEGEVSGLL